MTRKKLQQEFTQPLLSWFDLYGRKDLPWQIPRTPYRVWISEIMLQQTQVQTVIPYFNRFMQRFPDVNSLAMASEDEVLSLWSGLGYYSRARNIHRTAKLIKEQQKSIFPAGKDLLLDLPGIGPSTAAAILSQAFNLPAAIMDGNVKRVLTRFFLIKGWPEEAQVKKTLWELADFCMPQERCADYTQAIMDLGATCCKPRNPNCGQCPVQDQCQAFKLQEQHLYPTKKIKKPVPIHAQQFLTLYNEQGLIYLEKRPPTGLWGGLWCLPGIKSGECPMDFIEHHYALKGDKPESIISFKHCFSHFHLEIDAVSIKVYSMANEMKESAGRWFTQEQLSSLGLAKPTTVILNELYNSVLINKC